MVIHAGQHGRHNHNLTSQLDSNSDLSKSAKTAHTKNVTPNPYTINKPPKKRENTWHDKKQSQ